MKKITFIVSVLFVCLITFGTALASEKEYVIGKGDSLNILVWGESELSTQVTVRPDGKISLPTIGDMKVAGLTPRALRNRIANALSELLFNPTVSVTVNTFPGNSIIVYGPGTNSAVVPLNGETTLLEILSNIRPDFNADLENAYLEREGQKIVTNFESIYKDGVGELADFEVLANDRLYIPKKLDRLIFIEGAVNSPTAIPYTENLTILEAIHKAGGFSKFADPNDTVINRKGTKLTVRLSDLIDEGDLSQNVTLEGGDLIVVDTSWF